MTTVCQSGSFVQAGNVLFRRSMSSSVLYFVLDFGTLSSYAAARRRLALNRPTVPAMVPVDLPSALDAETPFNP